MDLASLVREVVADFGDMLKAGQVVDTWFDCPDLVLTDATLLRRIVINLLSNASKYSSEQQTIEVKAIGAGIDYTLTVKDQGIGISEADQPHLFKWFFRGKNALNIGGTGLGLHLVAKYVELLRGSLSLESQLGKGTTVTITFNGGMVF
ncbi:sensor histidine kinase [Spirosoma pulveris]